MTSDNVFLFFLSKEQKCPTCNGLLHLDLNNNEETEKFIKSMNKIMEERSNLARNQIQLNAMRNQFWSMLILFLIWILLFTLTNQNTTMTAGHVLSWIVVVYGCLYICFYFINYVVNKYREKKHLKKEIESLIK